MHSFVEYVRTEMLTQIHQAAGAASKSAIVPLRKPIIVPRPTPSAAKNSRSTPKS
jgi:hypothetical protein